VTGVRDVFTVEETINKLPNGSASKSLAASWGFRSGKWAKKLCGFGLAANAVASVREARNGAECHLEIMISVI